MDYKRALFHSFKAPLRPLILGQREGETLPAFKSSKDFFTPLRTSITLLLFLQTTHVHHEVTIFAKG